MNLKLKSTLQSEGRLTFQHPGAQVGICGDVNTYEITDIPKGTPASEVVRLADGTAFLGQRFTARFDELGLGRILAEK